MHCMIQLELEMHAHCWQHQSLRHVVAQIDMTYTMLRSLHVASGSLRFVLLSSSKQGLIGGE